MIKSEREYNRIRQEVERQEAWVAEERKRLEEDGLSPELIKVSVGIAEAMNHNKRLELEEYERVLNGDFDPYTCSLDEIGKRLIQLRIWKGLSQSDLARRLNVSHAQVSKDERFQYEGASLEKVKRVLKVLDVELIFASPKMIDVKIAEREYTNGPDEMAATG
jgi:DNA-binding transcriptional regulator YiaG